MCFGTFLIPTQRIVDRIDNGNFSDADDVTGKGGSASANRKTPSCALRLFVILLVDDIFYTRLINESRQTPNRQQLDAGQVGENTRFWQDVQERFVDDSYDIPSLPLEHDCFNDRNTGLPHDITVCQSKWATSGNLRKWYSETHNRLSTFIARYDKSGDHEFCFDDLDNFLEKYVQGNRDAAYLATLASWRGASCDDLVQWFKDDLPDYIELVDGMELTPPTGPRREHHPASRNTYDLSTLDTNQDRLVAALETLASTRASDSPLREEYYLAKKQQAEAKKLEAETRTQAKKLEFEAKKEQAALKAKIDQRRNGLEFAQELKRKADEMEGGAHLSVKKRKDARAYRKASDEISNKFLDSGMQEFLGVSLDSYKKKVEEENYDGSEDE